MCAEFGSKLICKEQITIKKEKKISNRFSPGLGIPVAYSRLKGLRTGTKDGFPNSDSIRMCHI